ncbi:MAG TPA: aspartate 1-decarboxylase [Candidatus Monoglobus merdigallinarum]|uniref:Aspartate 1-decarboxylase n=1 Tax=Candidatus Monoglobus merdigallinarum TaxID=2838698 RepID=A0A9D1TM53_9FIRM|nr:aspartate 1-decarboxylase [Candidatus Monoglobus merdigallinarum]
MLIEVMNSKIHRATVTDANLNYIGSVTIDEDWMDEVGILTNQQVHIVNVTNGERLITYAIPGERGSGVVCLNGAAAHKASVGDTVIIIAYASMDYEEAKTHKPHVKFIEGSI